MGSVRRGPGRWTAAMLGLAVGAAALLAGTTGVARAGGPAPASSPDGMFREGTLPRPGASLGVPSVPDPGRPGEPQHWRGPGPDAWRGQPGDWRRDDWRRGGWWRDDWRHDDWRYHGYWYGGYWYPYRPYGYYGWRPAYPGQWVWGGWRWVWGPRY